MRGEGFEFIGRILEVLGGLYSVVSYVKRQSFGGRRSS